MTERIQLFDWEYPNDPRAMRQLFFKHGYGEFPVASQNCAPSNCCYGCTQAREVWNQYGFSGAHCSCNSCGGSCSTCDGCATCASCVTVSARPSK